MSTETKKEVKPILKYVMYGLIVVALVTAFYLIKHSSKKVSESQKIDQISLSTPFNEEQVTTSVRHTLPDFNTPVGVGVSIIYQIMEWNAQFPLMYANGGVRTSKGSLFAENGINCEIRRQDDCSKTITEFVLNSKALADGTSHTPMIIAFMGDGVPGMSAALNALPKGHKAIAFYSMGRSNGEDCFWGPTSWRTHPEACLGKGVVGVERDGDLNIVLKWASDNGIKVNANTSVYDSFALNIISCKDFNEDLCSKILSKGFEERDVVSNGKTVVGVKNKLYYDAYTTWTPADVTVALKLGGFSRIASTAEYTMQMPNISIIDGTWAESHKKEMLSIIKALGLAGAQVRSFPEAQEFAAKVSAVVYNDKGKDANYWLRYYRGSEEKDKMGNLVKLGGSQSFNLADAAMLFGIGNENPKIDRYKVTYDMFGASLTKLYPAEMKGMTSYEDLVDKSYLQAVLDANDSLRNEKTESSTEVYASGSTVTEQTSQNKLNIDFPVGSSVIMKSSFSKLDEVAKSAIISGSLTIFVYGHTDITGNYEANLQLSKDRAQSVALYLNSKGVPKQRLQSQGYGSDKPVYGSSSDTRNRCVEIVQGK